LARKYKRQKDLRKPKVAERRVKAALNSGDTAAGYFEEQMAGQGIVVTGF